MKDNVYLPFTKFGRTKQVRLRTFTDGKEDHPAKRDWADVLYVERYEDWYALLSPQMEKKTVRIVTQGDWEYALSM